MTLPTLATLTAGLPDYDPENLSVTQARHVIRQFVAPIRAVENAPILSALGRVLAADIVSPINVPAYDNSAMDGYAFNGASLGPNPSLTLTISGTAFAGHAYTQTVKPGECIRVMTGALMPMGCDTVVPQECTL